MANDVPFEVIDLLRRIRDKAWQCDRAHEEFTTISYMALNALRILGIEDGPGPNPRPYGWWLKK